MTNIFTPKNFAAHMPAYSAKTKMDVLVAHRDALRHALSLAESEIDGLQRTECGLSCSGCGLVLATEADFASHFIVSRLDQMNGNLNLGECPERLRQRATPTTCE